MSSSQYGSVRMNSCAKSPVPTRRGNEPEHGQIPGRAAQPQRVGGGQVAVVTQPRVNHCHANVLLSHFIILARVLQQREFLNASYLVHDSCHNLREFRQLRSYGAFQQASFLRNTVCEERLLFQLSSVK